MAVTGYVNTGGWLDTGNGLCRLWGEIEYYCTRSNNVVSFTGTFARIKYIRESGSWVSFYYNVSPGWEWHIYVPSGTWRQGNYLTGTRAVNATDNGNSASFTVNVAAGDSTIQAQVGSRFPGDEYTYGNLTLSIPTVSAASGQTISASAIKPTTATLNAAVSNWGTNCTAGTGQRVEYKRQVDSTWTTLAYSTATSHSRNLTGLKPGTVYDIRTYTLNGAGLGAYSTATTFKTQSIAGITPLLMALIQG